MEGGERGVRERKEPGFVIIKNSGGVFLWRKKENTEPKNESLFRVRIMQSAL